MVFGFIALEAGLPTCRRRRQDTVYPPARARGAAQGEELSSSDDKPQPVRRPSGKAPSGKQADDRSAPRDREMGAALRSVYQRAVDEKVPDEMMDLLGKLG